MHIFGKLVHIFGKLLVSRTSKQVSRNLGGHSGNRGVTMMLSYLASASSKKEGKKADTLEKNSKNGVVGTSLYFQREAKTYLLSHFVPVGARRPETPLASRRAWLKSKTCQSHTRLDMLSLLIPNVPKRLRVHLVCVCVQNACRDGPTWRPPTNSDSGPCMVER